MASIQNDKKVVFPNCYFGNDVFLYCRQNVLMIGEIFSRGEKWWSKPSKNLSKYFWNRSYQQFFMKACRSNFPYFGDPNKRMVLDNRLFGPWNSSDGSSHFSGI